MRGSGGKGEGNNYGEGDSEKWDRRKRIGARRQVEVDRKEGIGEEIGTQALFDACVYACVCVSL